MENIASLTFMQDVYKTELECSFKMFGCEPV